MGDFFLIVKSSRLVRAFPIMRTDKLSPKSCLAFLVGFGSFPFSALALLAFAAALFVLISDDFVVGGQIIPATDPGVLAWRSCLILAGVFSGILAWFCYRHSCRVRVG